MLHWPYNNKKSFESINSVKKCHSKSRALYNQVDIILNQNGQGGQIANLEKMMNSYIDHERM